MSYFRVGQTSCPARAAARAILLAAASLLCACDGEPPSPSPWVRLVPVAGQSEPVPEQWLKDEEGRIAHSLRLPAGVPQPQPFDFERARAQVPRDGWLGFLTRQPDERQVAVLYFDHLCKTEAGQWIFKTVANVEGLYFARPQSVDDGTSELSTDPWGPEAPWIQRILWLLSDTALNQGSIFIQSPLYNYLFVEQPRRDVKWQAGITTPYVRLFGYTREFFVKPGQVVADWNERTPMQVAGVTERKARYGYTWRGLKRAQDREHGIAGSEVLIYDLNSLEVLAVRRQYVIASHNPRGQGKAMWEVGARCPQLPAYLDSGEFTQLAFDVIHTIKPSHQ